MRIIWSSEENWFQAELPPGENWRDDMELVKQSGFKTTGAPTWLWYTSKASTLNKLRDKKPKSGLIITEVALEKYKFLNEQEQKKVELKKLFEKGKQAAQKDSVKRPEYEKDGFVSFVVDRKDTRFAIKYVRPVPPAAYCFVCGDPVYDYEGTDLCLWCSEKF